MVDKRRMILDMAMDNRILQLEQQVAKLKRENKTLRKENEAMRKALKMMTLLSQISVKAINKIMLPIWRYELFVMVFWLLSELSRCLISSIAYP